MPPCSKLPERRRQASSLCLDHVRNIWCSWHGAKIDSRASALPPMCPPAARSDMFNASLVLRASRQRRPAGAHASVCCMHACHSHKLALQACIAVSVHRPASGPTRNSPADAHRRLRQHYLPVTTIAPPITPVPIRPVLQYPAPSAAKTRRVRQATARLQIGHLLLYCPSHVAAQPP